MNIWTFIYIEDGVVELVKSLKKSYDIGKWFKERYWFVDDKEKILEELEQIGYYSDGNGCEYIFEKNELD